MGLDTTISAKPREERGKNAARRLRASGQLPAIFYGQKDPSQALTLDYAEFKTAYTRSDGARSLFTLSIEGQAPQPVLLKDIQINPLSRRLAHLDLLKIDPGRPITVQVPLTLTGKAVGVEKGGQLQQGERDIKVSGLPEVIPAKIDVDVSALGLGQTMHLSQVKLPEGLSLERTVDLPVAVVAVPKGLKAEVEEAAKAPTAAGAPAKAGTPAKAAPVKAAPKAAKPVKRR
ncbi:MAG: 50S ribosomal protein L25 [Deltaproteobacteria bacterium]|jgi:large subunit ribosomal protein L25|nr:50S ribosomal protein L25 [Deltaproteobacteria bacterium]